MTAERRFRTFGVRVWDGRAQESRELTVREFTVADATAAVRQAGWHDGILSVREVPDVAEPEWVRRARANELPSKELTGSGAL